MFGRAVRAHDRDPVRSGALAERDGYGRAAEPDAPDAVRVLVGEPRVVEEAREEHRRARACSDVRLEHDVEHAVRVPAVDEVDVLAERQGREDGCEHARSRG